MDNVEVVEPKAEEIYRSIQYKAGKILNNPRFKELFIREVDYIYYKTKNKKIIVDVKPELSLVSLRSYNRIIDCRRELIDKNESFIESVFYLFNNDLVLESSQGVIFARKDLESIGLRSSLSYETKLETNFMQKIINGEGIEFSCSTYNDSYPLKKHFEEIDVEELITSNFYRPIFNTFHLPEAPIHIGLASIRNTYRKMNELHLVHTNIGELTRDGYKNVTAMLASSHYSYPELLRADIIFARVKGNKNADLKFKVIDSKLGETIPEISRKAKEEFKKNIENSFTKRDNIQIYNSIIKYL